MIFFNNEKHTYVLTFDIEFDQSSIVQFAGILFKKINDGIYAVYRTINIYVSCSPSYPFKAYTHLTQEFLVENGVRREDLVQQVEDVLLKDIPLDDLLIVSHGLQSDREILIKNCINLQYDPKTIKPIDGYCTFTHARKILNRKENLKLCDVAREAGWYMDREHNAFNDAWATA
jgi:DNA polymerase III alpha subunit (gram-positive type)